MKKLLLLALAVSSCRTVTEVAPPPPAPACPEPAEIVKEVVKEVCPMNVEFTSAVDQWVPGVVICVLDPSVPAMLCMTPKEAAERAALSSGTP